MGEKRVRFQIGRLNCPGSLTVFVCAIPEVVVGCSARKKSQIESRWAVFHLRS